MKALLNWLDHRTGYRKLVREALFENVPGGSRWRYVWGSTLSFTLMVQFITGVFLWMAYSPSSQTAWESVYYIQNQMLGGWLLRGIHHYTAHAMTLLLVLHLMQVVIDGAYKAPREVNFWFGMVLLLLVLALSLTGYLLPWDQKGYWATKVATSISAITPYIGPEVQKLIVGGAEYGHHTLTRFFALHAGVLPGAIVVLLVGHIYLFRRHGLTAKEPKRRPDAAFWPDQVLKDAVACLAVLAVVLFLTIKYGAGLAAPADPAENYAAARPEWYFMFLFELLKYFPGESEIWGAMIWPGLVLVMIFAMPFFGRWRLGHWFNLGMLWALLCGVGLLTWLGFNADRNNPGFVAAVRQAEIDAEMQDSAVITEGRTLLAHADMRCTECHQFRTPDEDATAPDLTGYGSREWLTGILTNPKHERFYGKRNDRMPAFGEDKILDAQSIGLLSDWLRGDWYVAPKE